ncbi:hypothetical protein LJR066_002789 [Acidovorax sp. LjRoot66]|uniref:hypothetical protein n=1 Tax=Acidovorax sp. LjRoot66 TaxID=3342334 RepID=UPI003ED0927F
MADAPKPKRHMLHMEVPGKNCIVGYWSDDALAPDGYPPLPAPYARAVVGGLSRGVEYPDIPATYTADQMRAFVDADRAARATPSPPVAAPPATPVTQSDWQWVPKASTAAMQWAFDRANVRFADGTGRTHPMDPASEFKARYAALLAAAAQPQPQPAQPLTDEQVAYLCGEANRGYCIDREDYFKAFRDAEEAHGITAPSTPTPPEVAP